jgi:hypothetical protein
VKDAAVASDAEAVAGAAVPPVGEQEMLTVTEPPLFGTKSLATVKAWLFRLFVIVQLGVPPFVSGTLAQPDWVAV